MLSIRRMDSKAEATDAAELSVVTAAVLASPDCVGVILDFVGLDHFPVCSAVSRCFRACVRDKQELWNVLRPEHLISKNNSGLVEPCHAVAMGGDLIGVLDVGGSVGGISPCLRTLCAASGEMLGTPARTPPPRSPTSHSHSPGATLTLTLTLTTAADTIPLRLPAGDPKGIVIDREHVRAIDTRSICTPATQPN